MHPPGLGKTKRMDTAASGTSGFSHIPDHIAKAKTMTGYAARGTVNHKLTAPDPHPLFIKNG